ncbi:MAG TPA: carboxypeptidase regulatory-like domain-containing protein [Terriglobales bacterium]|nr:carboxypeptidase regulatory-like domain-containing protein [Terriglobales bacterium]
MKVVRVLACLLVLLLPLSLMAQTTTGTIAGTVTDASGAVVSGATVTITDTDRNIVARTVTTGGSGAYSAPLLPVGHYSITVEGSGFQKYTQAGIVLNASDKLTYNPVLKVGSNSQEVTVQAETNQVELQSTQAAGLVTGTQVRELSLNGRNWEQLLTLTPGVSDAGNSDQLYVGNFAPQGTNLVGFSMNGGRREENNYMIDGADNIDRGSNLTLLSFPSVDSISEFRVIRGQYDPEYGRAASGQVNVITRSGTSSLHGNLYEFWRNDALNARPFASKYPTVTPHIPYLRYHDFGGTIGGPVWIPKIYEQKNKTFFFFSEEARRNLTYTNGSAVVPTSSMLQGNFAHPVCVQFVDDTGNNCAAYGTSIAAANFNPISKAYITDIFSKYPQPNNGAFGYTSTLKGIFNYREEIIKIDHIFSQKFSVSGKIARDTIPTQEPGGLFTGMVLDGIGTTSTNSPGHNYTFRATLSLTPTLLIEPGYAYSYGAIVSDPIGLVSAANSPNVAAAVKLPFASQLDRIPNITLNGGSGPASFGPYRDFNRNHTVFTNVTKIHGGHTVKAGFTYYHYNKSENAGGNNAGVYAFGFGGQPTFKANPTVCGGAGGPACPIAFEQAWANFLLGHLNNSGSTPGFSQSSFDLTADILDNSLEWYAQDTWRARPNLTVSYGMRWSFFRQPTDGLGLLSQFDPAAYDPAKAPCVTASGALDISRNPATGVVTSACNPNYSPFNGIIFAGTPPAGGMKSPYGSKVGKEYNRAIAPRVGIAWDPWGDGKTSVRAGIGMFYDPGLIFGNAENDIFLGTGFLQNPTIQISNFSNPLGGTTNFSTAAPSIQSRIPIDYKYPSTQQWSLDVQREIAAGWILDLGYYGNTGVHLPGFYDFNQPAENAWTRCVDPSPCTSGGNTITFTHNIGTTANPVIVNSVDGATTNRLNALRPFIGFNGAQGVRNIYTSNYNGLQTQLVKQFRGNSLVNISYTWSHGLTTNQADRTTGGILPIQGHIRDNTYGPTIGDRRHNFTANFVWEIPFMRQQQGFAGKVLGGWQVSGVQTFQSGLPATVTSNQALDPTGADCLGPSPCSFRANQVGDPNANEPQGYEGWFNASAFTDPALGQTTIPSERPGAVRLPGFWRTDLGVFKNMKFTERFTGQLRVETFNTFNHLNPICCASFSTSSSLYNKIRSARDPRTMQLGLKLQF